MKLETISFITNDPVQVSLTSLTGIPKATPKGTQVFFTTTDGRALWLEPDVVTSIGNLGVEPGEPFCVCKRRALGRGGRIMWDLWKGPLQGPTEQKAPHDSLEAALARSLDRGKGTTLVMPSPEPEVQKGTGTYGPVPVPRPAVAKHTVGRIPLNVAVREIIAFTTDSLKTTGQQWSENSIQDLVSTVIIAATKAGYTTLWER